MKLRGPVPDMQFEYHTEDGVVYLGRFIVWREGRISDSSCELTQAAEAFAKKCRDGAMEVDGMFFYPVTSYAWRCGDIVVVAKDRGFIVRNNDLETRFKHETIEEAVRVFMGSCREVCGE